MQFNLLFGGRLERYLFRISFNGFYYSGWQIQKNAISVQGVIQDAIKNLVCEELFIVSCSRTDSGVHANNFYFHIDLKLNVGLDKFKLALNNLLPPDIVVKDIKKVGFNFHARYSAKRKEYIYKIWTKKLKNPFLKGLVLHYNRKIDVSAMLKAKKFLIGRHDFSSFCGSKSNVVDKVRTIYLLDIFFLDDILIFKIVGDGFLYNMVRIVVGTLLEVSEKKISPSYVKTILLQKDRRCAGRTVKPDGLYLNEVIY